MEDYKEMVLSIYPDAQIDWMKKRSFKPLGEMQLEFWVMRFDDNGHHK